MRILIEAGEPRTATKPAAAGNIPAIDGPFVRQLSCLPMKNWTWEKSRNKALTSSSTNAPRWDGSNGTCPAMDLIITGWIVYEPETLLVIPTGILAVTSMPAQKN